MSIIIYTRNHNLLTNTKSSRQRSVENTCIRKFIEILNIVPDNGSHDARNSL